MLISPDNTIIKNVSVAFPKISLVLTFLEFVFIGRVQLKCDGTR